MFDVEIDARERQFLAPGDAFALAQAEGAAQEIGKADAHFAGASGVDRGERGDRIEAVEEEMRIDLGFERAQLGFAGLDFGFAGLLDGQQGVVQSDRYDVEKKADDHHGRNGELKLSAADGGRDHLSERDPESGGQDRRAQMIHDQREPRGRSERLIPAHIPGGEADEGVEQAQRSADGQCVAPAHRARHLEQTGQQNRKDHPQADVQQQRRAPVEDRVHG